MDKNSDFALSRDDVEHYLLNILGWKVFSRDDDGRPLSYWDGVTHWRAWGWQAAYRESLKRSKQLEMFS